MTIKLKAETDLKRYTLYASQLEALGERLKTEKTPALRLETAAVKRKLRRIERGLSLLTPEQYRIMELMYINRTPNRLWQLCEELHVEPSMVYRHRKKALRIFILGAYGIDADI
ncbi:MAG: hypothetical protein GX633_08760 [Clostridiales bacterium]|nr:hypothetical protein [Clostridiales bacterium]